MHAELLQYGELLGYHMWEVMRKCQVVQGSERHEQTNLFSTSELHTYSLRIASDKDAPLTLVRFNDGRAEESSSLSFPDKRWADLAHLSAKIFDRAMLQTHVRPLTLRTMGHSAWIKTAIADLESQAHANYAATARSVYSWARLQWSALIRQARA